MLPETGACYLKAETYTGIDEARIAGRPPESARPEAESQRRDRHYPFPSEPTSEHGKRTQKRERRTGSTKLFYVRCSLLSSLLARSGCPPLLGFESAWNRDEQSVR